MSVSRPVVIGVPREIHRHELRVGLVPFAVSRLVKQGHAVLVERGAGAAAHFADADYEAAGARIVYTREEAYGRADIICQFGRLAGDDLEMVRPESTVCGFHHLAVAPRESVERLMELGATLIGYEIIADSDGHLPVLFPFSEMAGQMAVHIAAQYLQNEFGGRGILLGNVPGVPPPTVLILGAGAVGRAAARRALASGAHAIVLDADLARLRAVHRESGGRAVTVAAGTGGLVHYTAIADVVIGAVLIPGGRAPFIMTEEMVKGMKPGSVIIDVSIDQGGCVETSRPTTLDNPIFVAHGVIHYCVPNMTANVARTASRSLANAALPYVQEMADRGLDRALQDDPGLAAGLHLYRGVMVNRRVGEALGIPVSPLSEVETGART